MASRYLSVIYICMDCNFAVQQCNLSQLHFETDKHNILARCIPHYKNRRGVEYCQLVQPHKAVRATPCCECKQIKMGTMSQNVKNEMLHDGENVFYMNKIPLTGSEHCLELQCLEMKRYSARPGEMNEPYVTGYMVTFCDHNWADWFQQFPLQTACEYSLRKAEQHSGAPTGIQAMFSCSLL